MEDQSRLDIPLLKKHVVNKIFFSEFLLPNHLSQPLPGLRQIVLQVLWRIFRGGSFQNLRTQLCAATSSWPILYLMKEAVEDDSPIFEVEVSA